MYAVVELDIAQIVLIAACAVYHLAEQALAHHPQRGHHVAAIAYVFEDIQL